MPPESKYSGLALLVASAMLMTAFTAELGDPAGDFVEVTAESEHAVTATPGEIVSTVFTVRNTTDSIRTFVPTVSLPANWMLVSSRSAFAIAANGISRRVVSFRVPPGVEPGQYPVEYGVLDSADESAAGKDVVLVAIGSVQQLDLQIMRAPGFVSAGSNYTTDFVLMNTGNSSFGGSVRVRSVPEFETTVTPSRVELDANTSGQLSVVVTTRALGIRRFRHWIKVEIVDNHGEVVASSSASVDVLPVGKDQERPGTIPARIRVVGFDSYRGRGAQLEFEAAGAVREESSSLLDLFVRTPDRSTSSLFARRDEYRLTFSTDNFAVRVGDQTFRQSPLTEFGRRSRGIGVEGYAGPMTLGIFAGRNRNAFPKEDVVGATLAYALTDRLQMSANFIDKTGQYEGQTITLRTRYEPVKNSTLDLELGNGGNSEFRSLGLSAAATGRYDLFSYNLRHLATDRGFPGRFQDYANTTGSVSFRPTTRLSFLSAYQIDERTFQSTAAESVQSKSKFFQIGPAYDFSIGSHQLRTTVRYNFRAQNAVAGSYWSARNEQIVRGTADLSIAFASVGVLVDIGSVNSNLMPSAISGRRYGAHARTNQTRLSSSIYFERTEGATINRATDSQSTSFGATLDYDLTGRTYLGVNAYTFQDNGIVGVRYSLLATELKHTFPFGHTAMVQTNLSSFGAVSGGVRADVSFSYEIPLHLPSLRPNTQILKGRVVDFESGDPIAGTVLRLGREGAVTNAKGEFELRWEPESSQYLFMDQGSIGLDRLPMISMPMTITEQALATLVEIPVARAGELFGVVRRYEYGDGAIQSGELAPAGVEPEAVVEVSDDAGSYRTTTDAQGRFAFRNLRPGKWTARIVFVDNSGDYRTETLTRKHTIEPGERVEIELRTLPKKRTIKFVAGGRVSADDSTFVRLARNRNAAGKSSSTLYDLDAVPSGDALQVKGRNPFADGSVANHVREAFEEALRVASNLDSTYVRHESMPLVESGASKDCTPAATPGLHVVRPGESLAAIARRYYCDVVMWPKVWLANYELVKDPHIIHPGDELIVPNREDPVFGFAYEIPEDPSVDEGRLNVSPPELYTVRTGDTLFGIAKRTLGDRWLWPRIWMINREFVGEDTDLLPGMKLIIPGEHRLQMENRVLFGRVR